MVASQPTLTASLYRATAAMGLY